MNKSPFMEVVILEFSTIYLLWRFTIEAPIESFKINVKSTRPKLVGEYSGEQIKLALTKYGANVMSDTLLNAVV